MMIKTELSFASESGTQATSRRRNARRHTGIIDIKLTQIREEYSIRTVKPKEEDIEEIGTESTADSRRKTKLLP